MVQNSNFDRVVELKNGVSSKNGTKNGKFIQGICLIIILIMVIACKKDEMEKFMHEPPPVITVTQVENGLKISWNEIRGVTSYNVERNSENKFENTLVYSFPVYANITFYIDENPMTGVNFYRVSAIKLDTKNNEAYALVSNVVSFNYNINHAAHF